jgi:hypothetical protein
MIIAQSIIVLPIIAALSRQTIADLHEEYDEHLRSLGCTPMQSVATLLWDGRFRLLTAIMAGFGRAIAEVGAVIIVGGNIQHATRVMTTTIALETSKGNLVLALGLGLILVTLALGVNATALVISDAARRPLWNQRPDDHKGRVVLDRVVGPDRHTGAQRCRQERDAALVSRAAETDQRGDTLGRVFRCPGA